MLPWSASPSGSHLQVASPSHNVCWNFAMTDRIRPLIAGNWKMNGLKASWSEFEAMLAGSSEVSARADLLVCPPATLLAAFADRAKGTKAVAVGAQDCHPK